MGTRHLMLCPEVGLGEPGLMAGEPCITGNEVVLTL